MKNHAKNKKSKINSYAKVKDRPFLLKDESTGVVVNAEPTGLQKAKAAKMARLENKSKIEILETRLVSLENSISEILNILKKQNDKK